MKLLKLCLFILLSILNSANCSSQSITTDSLKNDTLAVIENKDNKVILKYLVISSKDNFHRNRVYSENKRLLIKTYDKRRMSGRMRIVNDSTICLFNSITQNNDTFNLSEIRIIRSVSLTSNLLAIFYFCTSLGYFASGLTLVGSGILLYDALGAFMIFSSGPGIGLAALLSQGIGLNRKYFEYHIHYAKGYELKPNMVKYLYPPIK